MLMQSYCLRDTVDQRDRRWQLLVCRGFALGFAKSANFLMLCAIFRVGIYGTLYQFTKTGMRVCQCRSSHRCLIRCRIDNFVVIGMIQYSCYVHFYRSLESYVVRRSSARFQPAGASMGDFSLMHSPTVDDQTNLVSLPRSRFY